MPNSAQSNSPSVVRGRTRPLRLLLLLCCGGGVVVSVSCLDYVAPQPSGLLGLQAPRTAFADGTTLTPITAVIDPVQPTMQWSVAFTSTLGTFPVSGKQSISMGPTNNDTAIAYLQSPRDSGTAVVTATTGIVTRSDSIEMVPALVQAIDITPSAATLMVGTSASVTLSIHLVRAIGKVSPGTVVTLVATDSLGTAHGIFAPSDTLPPSDTTDVVTALYAVPDSNFVGPITITATAVSVPDVQGQTLLVLFPPSK
jgi:hypothetical protein